LKYGLLVSLDNRVIFPKSNTLIFARSGSFCQTGRSCWALGEELDLLCLKANQRREKRFGAIQEADSLLLRSLRIKIQEQLKLNEFARVINRGGEVIHHYRHGLKTVLFLFV
jgi:hypothetical protein